MNRVAYDGTRPRRRMSSAKACHHGSRLIDAGNDDNRTPPGASGDQPVLFEAIERGPGRCTAHPEGLVDHGFRRKRVAGLKSPLAIAARNRSEIWNHSGAGFFSGSGSSQLMGISYERHDICVQPNFLPVSLNIGHRRRNSGDGSGDGGVTAIRVLFAGESWMTHSIHVKGFDSFENSTYHEGGTALIEALRERPGSMSTTSRPTSPPTPSRTDSAALSAMTWCDPQRHRREHASPV